MKTLILVMAVFSTLTFAEVECDNNNCIATSTTNQDYSSMLEDVNPLQPIQFVPIVLYYENGDVVPVSAEMKMTVDEDGVEIQVTATVGDYLQKLNDIERKLNQMGRTLRDNDDFGMLTRVPTDIDSLEDQKRLALATLRAFDPDTMDQLLSEADIDQLIEDAKERAKKDVLSTLRELADESDLPDLDLPEQLELPTILKQKRIPKPNFKADKVLNWDISSGNASTLQIFAEAELALKGHSTKSTKTTEGTIGAAFGARVWNSQKYYLGAARASYLAPKRGRREASLRLDILGKTIYSKEYENLAVTKSDQYSIGTGVRREFRFMVGVVPCVVRVGARGKAYMGYSVGIEPLQAFGRVKAGVNTEAYAEAEATIEVAGVGARGVITLLKDEVSLNGLASVRLDDKDMPVIKLDINAVNEVTALSGRLYAYAYIRYPKCEKSTFAGISYPKCGNTKTEYKQSIFDWTGYENRGNIFAYHMMLSPFGSTYKGKDVSPEDMKQLKDWNEQMAQQDLNSQLNMAAVKLNELRTQVHGFFDTLGDRLNESRQIELQGTALLQQSDELEQKINNYANSL